MKPIKNLSFHIRCIKIYLEDIEEIIKIMGDGDNSVKISTDSSEAFA
jgi:hypothetical protein